MKKIPRDISRMVHESAPWFVRAVARARNAAGVTPVALERFADDPFLLYAALWYAYEEGVSTLVTAPKPRPRRDRL